MHLWQRVPPFELTRVPLITTYQLLSGVGNRLGDRDQWYR
jgi:hypothetical protein